jgi:hypothetical protein
MVGTFLQVIKLFDGCSSLSRSAGLPSNILHLLFFYFIIISLGSATVGGRLLAAEASKVWLEQAQVLSSATNLTANADGWTDRGKKGVMGTNVVTPARQIIVLGLDDVSGEKHTGKFLKG